MKLYFYRTFNKYCYEGALQKFWKQRASFAYHFFSILCTCCTSWHYYFADDLQHACVTHAANYYALFGF